MDFLLLVKWTVKWNFCVPCFTLAHTQLLKNEHTNFAPDHGRKFKFTNCCSFPLSLMNNVCFWDSALLRDTILLTVCVCLHIEMILLHIRRGKCQEEEREDENNHLRNETQSRFKTNTFATSYIGVSYYSSIFLVVSTWWVMAAGLWRGSDIPQWTELERRDTEGNRHLDIHLLRLRIRSEKSSVRIPGG